MLNGIMSPLESWLFQLRVLKRAGFNIVCHEFRGQWRSTLGDRAPSLTTHAEDLAALLDHLGYDRVRLIGTSYGGFVGLRFAAAYPERSQSLQIIASSHDIGPIVLGRLATWRQFVRQRDVHGLFAAMTPDVYAETFLARNQAAVDQRSVAMADLLPAAPDFFDGQDALYSVCETDVAHGALHPVIAQVNCASMIIGGEYDALYPPPCSVELARRLPKAQCVIVPNAGHAVVAEAADTVNTVMLGHLHVTGRG